MFLYDALLVVPSFKTRAAMAVEVEPTGQSVDAPHTCIKRPLAGAMQRGLLARLACSEPRRWRRRNKSVGERVAL